jgi:alpha-1,3/alpha-1,6-mannosyltransferase
VRIRGAFIPASLFGKFTAVLSTLRTIFLALALLLDVLLFRSSPRFDVIVVDVLPAPLPLLKLFLPSSALMYYCHFPDKYLVRNTVNGVVVTKASFLRSLYRAPLDALEGFCTSFADVVSVNSNFTAQTFSEAFPSIKSPPTVLYPAINLELFIPPAPAAKKAAAFKQRRNIISFNRFERKKNIGLALEMFALLKAQVPKADYTNLHLVIAGGYDTQNTENVEYMQELKNRCSELGLGGKVDFRPSISDDERADLLQSSLCLLYTPDREHFGIVPLEAMYAGSPVIAVASGGPLETVVDGKTGFLCDNTPAAFAAAASKLISDIPLACALGESGHKHVKAKFGLDCFVVNFKRLLGDSVSACERNSSAGRLTAFVLGASVFAAVIAVVLRDTLSRWCCGILI